MDPRHRVADRFFSDHYARLIQAMTFDQAKSILGFPPSSSPSPEEIKKVYLRMVRENHPDRGGSTEKMREINVAKDVLDGKQRPEGFAPAWRPQAAPPRDDPPPRPRWEPPKVVKTINGTSFASAVSGAVTGVEWKFISKPVYPGDAGGSQVWVAVGITAAYYVVIGVKHRETHQSFEVDAGGLVEYEEDWECNEVKVLITKPPLKALPLAIRSVCGLFKKGAACEAPKKYVLCPDGTTLSEPVFKAIRGTGGLSFKDVLLAAGMLAETDPAVAGRKSVVEMSFKYSEEKRKRRKALLGKIMQSDQYEVFVRVNGKEARLDDDTVANLGRHFFGYALSWDDMRDGYTRVLTQLKGSRYFKSGAGIALKMLVEALTVEPSWLIIALEKAEEEWDTDLKTATVRRIRSERTLKEAAEVMGRTLSSLFFELCAPGRRPT